ncbi:hypothetical protein [Nostoc sp. ChiQUE01b]|uniref:hypothetical protein n=1 Tax=Nostoc sp. ChiQUE01b TaxID=3075376 RepID=UPI002AD3F874|nr:hypothetical protein [Nostoc sp. ChiQUE01b]MDZ8260091.1 hypothetical protein [Nostoc sp. ChiQUE01b]
MLSVKGIFQNGVVHPNEPIEGHEGQSVLIVFVEENHTPGPATPEDSDWDKLWLVIFNSDRINFLLKQIGCRDIQLYVPIKDFLMRS